MSEPTIIIYGTDWCPDCRRTLRFLQQHKIPFQWINIDQDKDAEKYVLTVNRGMRSVPTLLFPDGTLFVEPSNEELARKLLLKSG
jgi:mycoredoxin